MHLILLYIRFEEQRKLVRCIQPKMLARAIVPLYMYLCAQKRKTHI